MKYFGLSPQSNQYVLFGLVIVCIATLIYLARLTPGTPVWNRTKFGTHQGKKLQSFDNVENFLAADSLTVGNTPPFALAKDDEKLNAALLTIVQQDGSKFANNLFTGFQQTEWDEDEIKSIIDYVLNRINLTTAREYHSLDMQSAKKLNSFDPSTGKIVKRFEINIFIQDKKSVEVHANATNISFTALQRDDLVKIEDLHTITDYFYDRPLVGGQNVYDKYYSIENPFHLTDPWKTSEADKAPFTDAETNALLSVWHKDLTKPKYRCFAETTDGGLAATNALDRDSKNIYNDITNLFKSQRECESNEGRWDAPVDNDKQCPFYRANKNYPNRKGGVLLGSQQCEMPINTKTVGFRYVSNDPAQKPWCYNCHIGADGLNGSYGPCCEEQNDPDLYPNLGGNPDYAFPGDQLERAKYWRELSERGLHWSAHPASIKGLPSDPVQKVPVFAAITLPEPLRQ